MNAIEIEEAVSTLALAPFNEAEFPYAFLMAFGNKETTIKRLRSGTSNKSDIGGVLQANNVHIVVGEKGAVTKCLSTLKESPATAKGKVRFIVTTDGADFEAEDLDTGETVACAYKDFPDHFGFFLPLAGISTVKQIRESSFDIRATSRLNRLYVELLKDNPEWGTAERRHEMNHLMARLIFSFFAEDTDIFSGERLFTKTVEMLSERDSSNTHQVISEIFRAMDTKIEDREQAKLPRWADAFPYVNGGLFAGSIEVPRFSRISRSYLLHIGSLDWTKINPDIFGSMIQAVADDEERGELGMHYTSVPNILKVLNPLFLDELKEGLKEAGENSRMLLNLRKRISKIRVFDPACGSGNFLVIAYKQLREIENTINERRGENRRASDIPLTNFRGIELRDFSAEIARLALVIAEYQCDLMYRGQREALAVFLPLDSQNWITRGNALDIDWLSVCPPEGTGVKLIGDDLFNTPLDQAQIDFENMGGETYICGNPPYKGNADQSKEQKDDLKRLLGKFFKNWKSLDYICGWFYKAQMYCNLTNSTYALVSTNSICQGQNISNFWKEMADIGARINFAVLSFKWSNLAKNKAGVTVVIIGGGKSENNVQYIYDNDQKRAVKNINFYLVDGPNLYIERLSSPISQIGEMIKGNYYGLSDGLLMDRSEMEKICESGLDSKNVKVFKGSDELISGKQRHCLWFPDDNDYLKCNVGEVLSRIGSVREKRLKSPDPMAVKMADTAHQFREMNIAKKYSIAVPVVSSEARKYLPVDIEDNNVVFSNAIFALYDAPLYNFAIIASSIHLVWIATVCGKLETRFRYSNTLGWNTFPVPPLTEKNKADLSHTAMEILLAREAHFPASIADLYDPETMPANLREAHEKNDEVLERIYIGRRFRNDTERLQKLFELYVTMTSKKQTIKSKVEADL